MENRAGNPAQDSKRKGEKQMATCKEKHLKNGKGYSYIIIAYGGYDENGEQIKHIRPRFHLPEGMKKSERKSRAQAETLKWEEAWKNGYTGEHTFKEIADLWEKLYLSTLAPNTQKRYKQSNYKEILAKFGKNPIDSIKPAEIQRYIDHIAAERTNKHTGENLKRETIGYYKTVLSSIFKFAKKRGYVVSNPCTEVELPKEKKSEKKIFTQEEAKKFIVLLEEAPLIYKAYFNLIMFSGLRTAEMRGLKWADIDFQQKTLTVGRTLNHIAGKGDCVGAPKTARSARTIPIPSSVLEVLSEYRRSQNDLRLASGDRWQDGGWIFTRNDSSGEAIGYSSPRQWVDKFCKRNGLPSYGLHSFRHLYATMLIYSGYDAKQVADMMGHASPVVTLNTYTHAFDVVKARSKERQEIAESLENLLDVMPA